ncbi:MAG: hypothetical protein ACOC8F_05630 [Planctomycetota bacterium]
MTPGAPGKSAAATALLAALLAAAGGCHKQRMLAKPLAPPVLPSDGQALADRWYRQWVDEPDRIGDGEVQEMVLLLGGAGREWREPKGPDGYVVRAILLDGEGSPTRTRGEFRVFAVHKPSGPEPRPLCAWTIPPDQAEPRFREGITPGYLLELDWGGRPAPAGLVMVVVRWTAADGSARITRNVVFEDMMDHGTRERYPRP